MARHSQIRAYYRHDGLDICNWDPLYASFLNWNLKHLVIFGFQIANVNRLSCKKQNLRISSF